MFSPPRVRKQFTEAQTEILTRAPRADRTTRQQAYSKYKDDVHSKRLSYSEDNRDSVFSTPIIRNEAISTGGGPSAGVPDSESDLWKYQKDMFLNFIRLFNLRDPVLTTLLQPDCQITVMGFAAETALTILQKLANCVKFFNTGAYFELHRSPDNHTEIIVSNQCLCTMPVPAQGGHLLVDRKCIWSAKIGIGGKIKEMRVQL